MKLRSITSVATLTCLAVAPAIAATTPVISGKYVYLGRTLCQPTITLSYGVDHNGQTFVTDANLSSPEGSAQEVGEVSFDPSTMMVSLNGKKDHGDNVLLQTSGGLQGAVISEKSDTGSVAYSNTATTITINGATYNATYGKLSKTSIPQYFAAVGLDSSGCSFQAEFTLK